jgi:hypothetical protein
MSSNADGLFAHEEPSPPHTPHASMARIHKTELLVADGVEEENTMMCAV